MVEIAVKSGVKTGCHTTLYNSPLQHQTRGPRCTISFNNTILFTILSSSSINTVTVVSMLGQPPEHIAKQSVEKYAMGTVCRCKA